MWAAGREREGGRKPVPLPAHSGTTVESPAIRIFTKESRLTCLSARKLWAFRDESAIFLRIDIVMFSLSDHHSRELYFEATAE